MKIPKRVNTAWDWAEQHYKALGILLILMVAGGAALVLPALAALIVGAFVGGIAVERAGARRTRRLRREIDELLRENGALRHEKTLLANGVLETQRQDTAALPVIPSTEPAKPLGADTVTFSIVPGLEPADAQDGDTASLPQVGSAEETRLMEILPDQE